MIYKLKRIFRKIYHRCFALLNHELYAKKIGVKMGQDVHIYGNPIGMFSTEEPWAITLGNHVHITRDVFLSLMMGGL